MAFAKPENALNRAEELIAVGQKQAALQALHDVITSKAREKAFFLVCFSPSPQSFTVSLASFAFLVCCTRSVEPWRPPNLRAGGMQVSIC